MPRETHKPVADFLPLRPTVLCVLRAVAQGHRHGYAIMRAVEETSAGAVRMGPGTLYGCLQRLCAAELARETDERPEADDDPRRRYYRLTPLGQAVLDAEMERLRVLIGEPSRAPRKKRLAQRSSAS